MLQGVIRIIASTEKPGLNAPLSAVFARAPYFVIVDVKEGKPVNTWSYPNTMRGVGGGAGRIIAEWVISTGARIVVASSIGSNAALILESAGIKIILAEPGRQVREILHMHGLLE